MSALVKVHPTRLAQREREGYTIIRTHSVVYDDGRVVTVPKGRYMDVIECERYFNKAYSEISAREETNIWLIWKQLHRHEDPGEHPPQDPDPERRAGDFHRWLETVDEANTLFQIDLEEDVVPLGTHELPSTNGETPSPSQ